MDLVNDSQPLGYLVEVQDDCESSYYFYNNIIDVSHYLTLDYPESRSTRLPYLFSNPFPFLLPPDRIYIEGYSVRAYWSGKEVRFRNPFVDPSGRAYSNNCSYNIRPASIAIEMICCDVDQVHITIEHGNSRLQYLFYKIPYFPVLVLHPSYIVDEMIVDGCKRRNSTKNTNPMYLNKDSYCLYDLLLLIYHWRVSAIPTATVVVDPISIFTSNISEIDMAHVLFTSACYKCLPSNSYGSSMTTEEYYEIVSTRVLPYSCGTNVAVLLAAYTILQLGGVVLPFIGMAIAFKPKESYWVLVRADPDGDSTDFYLIHSDLIIISKCGEIECPLYILYDSDFIPSLDCVDFSSPALPFKSGYAVSTFSYEESYYDYYSGITYTYTGLYSREVFYIEGIEDFDYWYSRAMADTGSSDVRSYDPCGSSPIGPVEVFSNYSDALAYAISNNNCPGYPDGSSPYESGNFDMTQNTGLTDRSNGERAIYALYVYCLLDYSVAWEQSDWKADFIARGNR